MTERPNLPTEFPTFPPTGDYFMVPRGTPKTLLRQWLSPVVALGKTSDPKSGAYNAHLGKRADSQRQLATVGGQSWPLSPTMGHRA